MPIIGLSTMVSAEAIERGRRVGLNDYVAKFDRQGLIAALKEQTVRSRMRGVSRPAMTANLEQSAMYVTATIGGQLFGLPIARVQDVFVPERMTPVPLAAAEIAGLINLRGRIVTMVDMRRRLGLPATEHRPTPMAIGVEWRGESYGLLIDEIGEVLMLPAAGREPAPVNLDARLARGRRRRASARRRTADGAGRGSRDRWRRATPRRREDNAARRCECAVTVCEAGSSSAKQGGCNEDLSGR